MKRTIFVSCLLVCLLTLSFVSCDSGTTSKNDGIKDGPHGYLNKQKWNLITDVYGIRDNFFMEFSGNTWAVSKADKILQSGTYKYKRHDSMIQVTYTGYFTTTFYDNTAPFKIPEEADFWFSVTRKDAGFESNKPNTPPILTKWWLEYYH